MKQTYKQENSPLHAAQQIVDELVEVRKEIKASAEGFAILDFVQGCVATELPLETARCLVGVLRTDDPGETIRSTHELVWYWLENYRRAYSAIIMRILEDGADSLKA